MGGCDQGTFLQDRYLDGSFYNSMFRKTKKRKGEFNDAKKIFPHCGSAV